MWDLIQTHIDNAPYPPSERQVAAKLGVSPNALRFWREPKKLPSRENLQAIADLVGVRYSVVLDAALFDTGYHENAAVTPLRRRPAATVEAELQAAEQDLAELPRVAGAEGKRAELQAIVDRLKAELSSSRRATPSADSVAKS
ncbi:helix-turn-helix domain-containing protein [Kribbella qitaiheensis]|uniref:helix-turn-helix domain-containing protein n=1 Tax=Kribbella qitaiheensis TaxID=1544730 RepID=UPI003619880E